MLDGGLKAAAGEALATNVEKYEPSDFQLNPRAEILATYPHLLEHLGRPDVQIFDVRSDAEYFSERVRAKHGGAIPGAVHQDWTASIAADGAVKSPADLRAQFEALGLDPANEIVPYCQGGYRAAHAYLALKIAGYPRVKNYLGLGGLNGAIATTCPESIRAASERFLKILSSPSRSGRG